MGNTADKLKHKPSTKVTLGEVLVSLKDLVRNEFYDPAEDSVNDSHGDGGHTVSAADQPRKRGRPRKYPKPRPQDYSYSQEQRDLFGAEARIEESAEDSPGKSFQNSAGDAPTTIKGAKPEIPNLEAKRPPLKLETGQIRTNLKVVGRNKPNTDTGRTAPNDRKPATPNMAKNSNQAAQIPEDPVSLNWADDIPVLTDIVDDSQSAPEIGAVESKPKTTKTPTPEARAIAVKVAAKLNIEMRETGGEQLDVKTIMRLQSLLKEALEPKD